MSEGQHDWYDALSQQPGFNNAFFQIVTTGADQMAETPDAIFKFLFNLLGVRGFFDPCPCKPVFNGLKVPWGNINYVNPPFSQAITWIKKAIYERQKKNCSIVLIPARTHNKYFANEIFQYCSYILILLNPVRFKPYKTSFPLPIMLCIFGPPPLQVAWPSFIHCYKVPSRCFFFPRNTNDEDVIPWLIEYFGPFDNVDVWVTNPKQIQSSSKATNFYVIMQDTALCIEQILHKHRASQRCKTVVLVFCRYCSKWFRELVAPNVSQLSFISPGICFGKHSQNSIIGSVALHFGNWTDAPPSHKMNDKSNVKISDIKDIYMVENTQGSFV